METALVIVLLTILAIAAVFIALQTGKSGFQAKTQEDSEKQPAGASEEFSPVFRAGPPVEEAPASLGHRGLDFRVAASPGSCALFYSVSTRSGIEVISGMEADACSIGTLALVVPSGKININGHYVGDIESNQTGSFSCDSITSLAAEFTAGEFIGQTWLYAGDQNGRPSYAFNSLLMLWNSVQWVIQDVVSGDLYYSSVEDRPFPWDVSVWVREAAGSGVSPVITGVPICECPPLLPVLSTVPFKTGAESVEALAANEYTAGASKYELSTPNIYGHLWRYCTSVGYTDGTSYFLHDGTPSDKATVVPHGLIGDFFQWNRVSERLIQLTTSLYDGADIATCRTDASALVINGLSGFFTGTRHMVEAIMYYDPDGVVKAFQPEPIAQAPNYQFWADTPATSSDGRVFACRNVDGGIAATLPGSSVPRPIFMRWAAYSEL